MHYRFMIEVLLEQTLHQDELNEVAATLGKVLDLHQDLTVLSRKVEWVPLDLDS